MAVGLVFVLAEAEDRSLEGCALWESRVEHKGNVAGPGPVGDILEHTVD